MFKGASILNKSLRPLLHSGGLPRHQHLKRDFILNHPLLLHCSQNSATRLTSDLVAVLNSSVVGYGCSALQRCTILRLVICEPITPGLHKELGYAWTQIDVCAPQKSVLCQKINLKISIIDRWPMTVSVASPITVV